MPSKLAPSCNSDEGTSNNLAGLSKAALIRLSNSVVDRSSSSLTKSLIGSSRMLDTDNNEIDKVITTNQAA